MRALEHCRDINTKGCPLCDLLGGIPEPYSIVGAQEKAINLTAPSMRITKP